jgi:hypothetical protein
MFQKLTVYDGDPIWVNTSLILAIRKRNDLYRITLFEDLAYDLLDTPELQALLSGATAPFRLEE